MGIFSREKSRWEPADRLLSYQVANLQGAGTRERQEDSFAFANAMDVTEIRRRGLLAVVADGMGGLSDGKLVSEGGVSSLLADFPGLDREGDLPLQLRDCALRAGRRLYERFHGDGGTTLVACLLFQERLFWVSVGDSFLYLRRGRGLYRLNRDQNYRAKLYLEAIRDGVLDPGPADRDPDGPRLSEFLGKEAVEAVDRNLLPLPLEDGDVLLLCSDGVGGVLDERVLAACLDAVSPTQACERIGEEIKALGRVNQDNYTALVVKCGY